MIEELTDNYVCPDCGSTFDELGVYGNRAHFACPSCGANMSAEVWRRIDTTEDATNEQHEIYARQMAVF